MKNIINDLISYHRIILNDYKIAEYMIIVILIILDTLIIIFKF